MEEEDSVDECEAAASSTVIKERRAPMNKFVKEVAPFCSIYGMDFKTLTKGHELGVREGQNGKVNLILAFSSCDVQWDRNNDFAEYDVSTRLIQRT